MQKQLSIGERIVDLRKAQSMSQKELAEKIGLSPSQLSRIENGLATTVTSDTLVALAQAFRVSTDYLLGLTAIRTPKNTDVAQLRLSETVLRRLLDGTLNADILNRLLEHRAFPYGEQNYDMIDGRVNNSAKENYKTAPLTPIQESVVDNKPAKTHTSDRDPKKRRPVLQRLNEKKAEVAARYGGKSPEISKDDMERNRK